MPRTTHRVADLVITVPADPALLPGARDELSAWLETRFPDGDDLRSDLLVVASELLANGAAAAPDVASELTARVRLDDGDVELEVSNPVAPWVDAAKRWNLDDPLRGGGRGLLIVRALVDEVHVVHDLVANLTTLRCRRSIPSG